MENGEQGDKKSVMEDICDKKDDVDNSKKLGSNPDCINLRVERPKSDIPENLCPVNIYSNHHDSNHCDSDSLL